MQYNTILIGRHIKCEISPVDGRYIKRQIKCYWLLLTENGIEHFLFFQFAQNNVRKFVRSAID